MIARSRDPEAREDPDADTMRMASLLADALHRLSIGPFVRAEGDGEPLHYRYRRNGAIEPEPLGALLIDAGFAHRCATIHRTGVAFHIYGFDALGGSIFRDLRPKGKPMSDDTTIDIRAAASAMGRKGGPATLKRHGREHFEAMGQKGGATTFQRYGREHFRTIGRAGGKIGGRRRAERVAAACAAVARERGE